jgi:pimeloyl-ACP methyl ester carboxylesterase
MQMAGVDGIRLEFEARGAGEPVVLIHGSAIADSYVPLFVEPSLSRYRLVRYRRRGFGGSTHSQSPVSIRQQAADCLGLMRHRGIEKAHLAGHSYGGAIAIQLALDFPRAVHSVALLEPALIRLIPSAGPFLESFSPLVTRYRSGDRAGALDGFMRLVDGPNWRNAVNAVPGAHEMAIADLDTMFQVEGPALQEWQISREDAGRIKQPVLCMVGGATEPIFRQTHELARSWFPQAETATIERATHMLQMVNARAVAGPLADFFARHPMSI